MTPWLCQCGTTENMTAAAHRAGPVSSWTGSYYCSSYSRGNTGSTCHIGLGTPTTSMYQHRQTSICGRSSLSPEQSSTLSGRQWPGMCQWHQLKAELAAPFVPVPKLSVLVFASLVVPVGPLGGDTP